VRVWSAIGTLAVMALAACDGADSQPSETAATGATSQTGPAATAVVEETAQPPPGGPRPPELQGTWLFRSEGLGPVRLYISEDRYAISAPRIVHLRWPQRISATGAWGVLPPAFREVLISEPLRVQTSVPGEMVFRPLQSRGTWPITTLTCLCSGERHYVRENHLAQARSTTGLTLKSPLLGGRSIRKGRAKPTLLSMGLLRPSVVVSSASGPDVRRPAVGPPILHGGSHAEPYGSPAPEGSRSCSTHWRLQQESSSAG
jgi:hypothetical protein